MEYPVFRKRRLRQNKNIRRLVRETRLSVDQLICPLFVCPGTKIKKEIPSMPCQYHFSIDYLIKECRAIQELGIPAILLFGIPEYKDAKGSSGYKKGNIISRAVQEIKKVLPELLVITDVCLCEYTDHGHCGIIRDNQVDNDATLKLLQKQALIYAESGSDMLAPSDMMDGRIAAIREALDQKGFTNIPIMAYSAKYASSFYGPFREAAQSTPQFGDRKAYQMDPSNSREAISEALLDLQEGADIIMVKPALTYLDIITQLRTKTNQPIAAYNVSGEYSCIKAGAANGWINEEKAMHEVLTSIHRAGADIIISYFAKSMAQSLLKGKD